MVQPMAPKACPRAPGARLRAMRRQIAMRQVRALVRRRVNAIMANQGRRIVQRRVAVLMRPHRAAGHGPQRLAQIRRHLWMQVARRVRAHFRRQVKRHIRQTLHLV
jgi:hypothetical protein